LTSWLHVPTPDPSFALTQFESYAAHYASWIGDLASLAFVAVVTALAIAVFALGVLGMTTVLAGLGRR